MIMLRTCWGKKTNHNELQLHPFLLTLDALKTTLLTDTRRICYTAPLAGQNILQAHQVQENKHVVIAYCDTPRGPRHSPAKAPAACSLSCKPPCTSRIKRTRIYIPWDRHLSTSEPPLRWTSVSPTMLASCSYMEREPRLRRCSVTYKGTVRPAGSVPRKAGLSRTRRAPGPGSTEPGAEGRARRSWGSLRAERRKPGTALTFHVSDQNTIVEAPIFGGDQHDVNGKEGDASVTETYLMCSRI